MSGGVDDSDDILWQGISDEEFSNLVSDIEEVPRTAPLHRMRNGHVWVSDLSSQIWCEQMLVYKFTLPMEIVTEPEHVTVGKNIHLARELQVQDAVPVKVTSKEDAYAIKLLNLWTAVESFHNGSPCVREIPVFGLPFDSNVFVTGIVDELRLDVDSFEIDVVELKTRKEKKLPNESTMIGHRFQAMLYKNLLDNLIKGKVSREAICKHLKLRSKKELGEDILTSLREKMCFARNLHDLFEKVLNVVQTIPCPSNVFIEYISQTDSQTFHLEPVCYDENWLNETCQRLFDFWKGSRHPEGVREADTWKCHYCEFYDFCEWRKKKCKDAATNIEDVVIID